MLRKVIITLMIITITLLIFITLETAIVQKNNEINNNLDEILTEVTEEFKTYNNFEEVL